jgi:hypothetical protein
MSKPRKQPSLRLEGSDLKVRLPSRKPTAFEQRKFTDRYSEMLKAMPKRITK